MVNKPSIFEIMKQAKKMKKEMQSAQRELANLEITGESGGGMVKVTMNGRYEAKKVFIDNEVFTENKEILEDLLAAAINNTVHKIEQSSQSRMSDITKSLGLPTDFKL